MKKKRREPEMQPEEAAAILSKRAALLRQIGPELLEDNQRTKTFVQALEMGARALLKEAGVEMDDAP